ncbi:unnamed protein product [Acanthoscelides obtectus]|uniref:Coiled-coil domain-containing protein 137 n=1 Tax=Acanthoscelides obtectus TaxID=200917 RepID=A0A9P0KY71_ACAOB|nr:unnamed protein product [Acanthoscelides obtectus]CAK1633717.1 hypothetical protein AOBTE_LOCUS8340 [Acanthoscelides obtectus]
MKVEALVKRPKDELEIMLKKIRKEKKGKKLKKNKGEGNTEVVRLTKSQKWALKKKEKKLKKQKRHSDEFKKANDNVKFGETVHAPPSLSAPKKASIDESGIRPGKKNLLLKSMLKGNKENKADHKADPLRKTSNKVIDKKGKRRCLPNAMRRQLDSQQKEIIAAYKELKAKKYLK